MRRVLAVTVALAVSAASAWAFDATSDFKKMIEGMIPRFVKAFDTKDVKFFAAISTPDFTEVEMGRTYDKKQTLAEMKSTFAACKSISCSFKLVSAKAKGDMGVAITSAHMTALMKGSGQDRKTHRLVMDSLERETWVRKGGIWKVKSIVDVKPPRVTMDGKALNGGG